MQEARVFIILLMLWSGLNCAVLITWWSIGRRKEASLAELV
jgi:hypothetical protein